MKHLQFPMATAIITLVVNILLVCFAPSTNAWTIAMFSLWIFFFAQIPFGFEKRYGISVNMSIVEDIYMLSAVCAFSTFEGLEHWYLLVAIAFIPIVDIIAKLSKRRIDEIKPCTNRCISISIIEGVALLLLLGYIVYLTRPYLNSFGIAMVIVSVMMSLCAYIVSTTNLLANVGTEEKKLGFVSIALPIGLCASAICFDEISTAIKPHLIAVGVLIMCIILLNIYRNSR